MPTDRCYYDEYILPNNFLDYIKMISVPIDKILSYKESDFGCFYMIRNIETFRSYVGRSKSFVLRMKSHLYSANNCKGLLIDIDMHGRVDEFEFFILTTYEVFKINYYNRFLASVIEQKLIKVFNAEYPFGYNQAVYEWI